MQAHVAALYAAIESLAAQLGEMRDIVEGLEFRVLDVAEDTVHAAEVIVQSLL